MGKRAILSERRRSPASWMFDEAEHFLGFGDANRAPG